MYARLRCLSWTAMRLGQLGKIGRLGAVWAVASGVAWKTLKGSARLAVSEGEGDNGSKFSQYFAESQVGLSIEDYASYLSGQAEEDNKSHVLIFLNPMIFNEKFLSEVQTIVANAKQAYPDLKVFYLTPEDLPEESKKALEGSLANPIAEQTLFLMKRKGQKKFDHLPFNTYFQNQNYVHSYFESLKTISDKNKAAFVQFSNKMMQPDQLFIIGVLSEDEETQADQVNRLKQLKLSVPAFNSENVGLVAAETDVSDWSEGTSPGDVLLAQVKHYTRIGEGADGNSGFFFKRIPGGVALQAEELSKEVSKALWETNVFFSKDLLENAQAHYLVKMKINANKMSPRDIRDWTIKTKTIRACLEDKAPDLGAKTVFVLEKSGSVSEDGEIIVEDLFRSDLRTMYVLNNQGCIT